MPRGITFDVHNSVRKIIIKLKDCFASRQQIC
jgi:hypothetical protein